jgi:hypothetical protein
MHSALSTGSLTVEICASPELVSLVEGERMGMQDVVAIAHAPNFEDYALQSERARAKAQVTDGRRQRVQYIV